MSNQDEPRRGHARPDALAGDQSIAVIGVAGRSPGAEECDMALAGGVSIHVKHPEGYRYIPCGYPDAARTEEAARLLELLGQRSRGEGEA